MEVIMHCDANVLAICGICEEPHMIFYEIKRKDKCLCICPNCLNEFANIVADKLKQREEKLGGKNEKI